MNIKEKLETAEMEAGSKAYERLETLLHGQAEVLEMISRGVSLPAILESITNWVELQANDSFYASILLVDEQGKHLLHGAAPSISPKYNMAIHGVAIGDNVGSCGTAAFLKETVIVEDIATDPRWKNYKDLALSAGLHACWSTPLINKHGKVLGTFAIYYPEPKKPSHEDLQLIRLISRTAVLAIEHRQSQEERENDTRFRSIIEQAPVAMGVLKGKEMKVEIANDLLLEIWGKDRSVIGLPLMQALPEMEGQPFPRLLDHVLTTGEPYYGYEANAMLVRKGQMESAYFNFVYAPYKEDGEITGVQVVASEVTAQVLTKKQLEESESRFRNLIMEAPVATALYIGREMKISLANSTMLQLWGKGSSAIGKTVREALPELEGQPFHQLLDDVFTSGVAYSAKEQRADLVVDGKLQEFHFNFTYKPLTDIEGKVYAILNMAVDVTEGYFARKKLEAAEERLRLAAEGTGLGTWDLDLQTSEIVYSPVLNEIFGWEPHHKLTQKSMRGQIHREDIHAVVEKAFEHALKTGLYDYEARVIHTGGDIKWIRTQGKIIYGNKGEPLRMVGTMRDITEAKKARIALEESEDRYRKLATELDNRVQERTRDLQKANENLERSNAELAQYAYVASHDLQEPLRKIRVFSSMLKDRTELSKEAESLLARVISSSDRMSQLIKDLLEFSRLLNAGKAMMTVDLGEVMRNVLLDFELAIKERHAGVHVDKLPVIHAVPLQMNQLFNNLLSNALKFSKADVTPVITVKCNELSSAEAAKYSLPATTKYYEISFSDNGIGFEPQFAEHIFEVFRRLHTRQAYPGSGIGLALCRKIVDNHNGHLFAKSQMGEGTVFHIILPENQF